MPAWEGPFKLVLKLISASFKEKIVEGTLYPIIEFTRSGTVQPRRV